MDTWMIAREASNGIFYAESATECIGPFGSREVALACATEHNRTSSNDPDIWEDDDGAWFQLRAPVSRTSVLFGPFALTEEDHESHGAENAYHALIANGWAVLIVTGKRGRNTSAKEKGKNGTA